MSSEIWVTEPCGNRYDANSVTGVSHSGYYESRVVTDCDKDYLKTICFYCGVYWERELRKIEPKND